ncbi:MAG: S-adenosylmethionine decarboxylase, partial [Planctomycetaceae bacterium]
ALVLLDESHCSVHCYADLGLMALDIFTCGSTDPRQVFEYIRQDIDLGDVTVTETSRFHLVPDQHRLSEHLLMAAGAP